ncbi:glycosyltransferase family 4 protein [Parasphingopyxis lamellibrachiae]|uniref:Glycosyltransferase involved in cell wall biosynthesis n=1 Tax=Parasphingopyxis lamellibrachiae TaxID=680125 RepID=A0A3D9FEA8_9SPHN|nr:glycosyltransferase family 1 protein [Parasphingopyxis lamellibrachiae]RED15998.1 glycosyltransferase involved in cell wall biosynthesis [Parasphingopyxis lamellibrachiae]
MRIAIVTDAWEPQINGVVRTLQSVRRELEKMGHDVHVFSPDQFYSLPCPTYSEIRLALVTAEQLGAALMRIAPDAIHIATEGPLGFAARRWCRRNGLAFTTAYHTQFPDYVSKRTGLPADWIWPLMRRFHAPSSAVLTATDSIRRELRVHGITHVAPWGRGVDLASFSPGAPPHPALADLPGPVMLYVGRVAIEKNIEAFLGCRHPGSKVVVGDGPARTALQRRHPEALFLGALSGPALAGAYAGADAFVFPSRTDTFGLVMIEALASGTPVAAYPVSGPLDVLNSEVACLDPDLDAAIAGALTRDRCACARYGALFSWERSAREFLSALVPIIREFDKAA